MVATNLIGKKVTTPEQMILQQIDERNATWAEQDNAWSAESQQYQQQYDAFVASKPDRNQDFQTKYQYMLTSEWIPTSDPQMIWRQMEAARNVANQYADQRQYDFTNSLISMQNQRTERISWYNSQLSGRNNQLEQYLNLRAEDAKAALARRQGLAAEQQKRASASYLADEEQFRGAASFLTGN